MKPKLPALRAYQFSLAKPAPPAVSFDADGRAAWAGALRRRGALRELPLGRGVHATTSCTRPPRRAWMPTYAARSATKKYRTTPLRGLWQHPPYFHDGSAATLAAVVDHYDATLELKLSAAQKKDLVEYLKSI